MCRVAPRRIGIDVGKPLISLTFVLAPGPRLPRYVSKRKLTAGLAIASAIFAWALLGSMRSPVAAFAVPPMDHSGAFAKKWPYPVKSWPGRPERPKPLWNSIP